MVLQITPRERLALLLLANGMSASEIACRFGVSEPEIAARLTALFARMGAGTRTEAISAAFRRGLLIPDDVRPLVAEAATGAAASSCDTDEMDASGEADNEVWSAIT